MEAMARMKNVGRGETILRYVIGAILIILALFISGVFGWTLGVIGAALIITAIFGY